VRVQLTRAATRAAADVAFVADTRRLRARCGSRCLGLSSSIGRPRDGRVTVLLDEGIAGRPTALNVWWRCTSTAMSWDFRHREGTCSLMNARAYDDACTFAGGAAERGPLPCGPVSGDVAAARACTGASRPPGPVASG
jgi:hypothetical protein